MAATISITGNLTQDPTLETVQVDGEDRQICTFSIGYSISRGRTPNNYIMVTTWGKAAASHAKWLTKGKPVRVDGELAHETWETKDGNKGSRHAIVNADVEFLGASASAASSGSDPEPAMVGGEPF